MIEQSESQIQREIIEYLQMNGVFVWRQQTIGVRGRTLVGAGAMRGVADILGCYKGKLLAIEVKRPGKKPSKNQNTFLRTVTAEGGLALCASSIDDVKLFLKL
jgi:Holliday junction resolvase